MDISAIYFPIDKILGVQTAMYCKEVNKFVLNDLFY